MEEIIKKNLSIKVKVLREKAHLTQEQLAEVCDVSWRTISNLERGIVTPDFKLVCALCQYFRIDLNHLLQVKFTSPKTAARLEAEERVIEKIKDLDDKKLEYLSEQIDTLSKYY